MGLTNLLDRNYIASLNDDKIVELFLHGDPLLKHETNVDIISMAQTFIEDFTVVCIRGGGSTGQHHIFFPILGFTTLFS